MSFDNWLMAVNSRKLLELGRNIKRYRKQAGLTQEELAIKIRVSAAYIGFLENGRRNPSLNTLDKIARVLKVSLKELL